MTLNDYQINTIRNLECEINIAKTAINYFSARREYNTAIEFIEQLRQHQSWLSNYILIITERPNV